MMMLMMIKCLISVSWSLWKKSMVIQTNVALLFTYNKVVVQHENKHREDRNYGNKKTHNL
jgi:hypothetical protein